MGSLQKAYLHVAIKSCYTVGMTTHSDKGTDIVQLLQSVKDQKVTDKLIQDILTIMGTSSSDADAPIISDKVDRSQIIALMANEDDWRKRASLAALLVRSNYE